MSILTGTTNLDGTGSSTNLTTEDSSLSTDNGFTYEDGTYLNETSTTYLYVDEWNKTGFKEAKVDNDDSNVEIVNFVDVNILNSNDDETYINVVNAKRGDIQTSDADDTISISVYSNNATWSNSLWNNNFNVNTGSGDDIVKFTDSQNSQFTSLTVDLGTGNDTLDLSGLNASVGASRTVDGGEGTDTLVLSDDAYVSFSNFEAITGTESSSLTLDAAAISANDSSSYGLVVDSLDLSFSSDVSVDSSSALTSDEAAYVASLGFDASDYLSVAVSYDDTTYHILTDDADFAAA